MASDESAFHYHQARCDKLALITDKEVRECSLAHNTPVCVFTSTMDDKTRVFNDWLQERYEPEVGYQDNNMQDSTDVEEGAAFVKCDEPCCSWYESSFPKDQYGAHITHHRHVFGQRMSKTLAQEQLTPSQLEVKRGRIRNLLCDEERCCRFDTSFSTTQAYENHINTESHKNPPPAAPSSKASSPALEVPDDERDGNWGAGDDSLICTAPNCKLHLHMFTNAWQYSQHISSKAHRRAASCETAALWKNTDLGHDLSKTDSPRKRPRANHTDLQSDPPRKRAAQAKCEYEDTPKAPKRKAGSKPMKFKVEELETLLAEKQNEYDAMKRMYEERIDVLIRVLGQR